MFIIVVKIQPHHVSLEDYATLLLWFSYELSIDTIDLNILKNIPLE